jgi:hypothetical protein
MVAAPIRTHSNCPHCGEPLRFRSRREVLCCACNEPVRAFSGIRRSDVCPNCDSPLFAGNQPSLLCMACNKPVRISWAYRRRISFGALLIVTLIGFVTHSRSSAGPWLVGLVLCWPLAMFLLSAIVPPTYERGYSQPQVTFATTFLAVFLSMFTVEFILLFAFKVLGAESSEIREHLVELSIPAVWFSQQFLITPEKDFVDVCGVMLANSFLFALPVFVCAKIVPYLLRRNRVTLISINTSGNQDDD